MRSARPLCRADKARARKLGQARARPSTTTEKVHGSSSISQGRLHRRFSTARGLPAALAGRYQADPRRRTADEQLAAVPILKMDRPPRQYRGVAPHGAWKRPAPNSARNWCRISKKVRSSTASSRHHRLRWRSLISAARRLVARHDIAWRRVNHPTEVLTIGQTVKVKIIKINQRNPPHLARHEATAGRSVAGHRGEVSAQCALHRPRHQTSPTTARSSNWSLASKAYPRFRKCRDQEEHAPGRSFRPRRKSKCRFSKSIRSSAGFSLGLKQTMRNPWESVRRKVPGGIDGRRRGQEPRPSSVMFLGLEGDVDGMVHLSDLD